MTKRTIPCNTCLRSLTVEVYSAGLSDVIPFTCPVDSTVLTVSLYDRRMHEILGGYPTGGLSEEAFAAIERILRACPCGDRFRHDVLPKCPHCNSPLRLTDLAPSEFVVLGRMIDGEQETPWFD